jgi:hypothetical protein
MPYTLDTDVNVNIQLVFTAVYRMLFYKSIKQSKGIMFKEYYFHKHLQYS